MSQQREMLYDLTDMQNKIKLTETENDWQLPEVGGCAQKVRQIISENE